MPFWKGQTANWTVMPMNWLSIGPLLPAYWSCWNGLFPAKAEATDCKAYCSSSAMLSEGIWKLLERRTVRLNVWGWAPG